jgi:two-component system heavy metal sensor histidine kinase CusS
MVSNLEELERLSAMVEAMLFLARADDPARVLKEQPIEIDRELQAVLDLYEPLAEASGVSLSLDAAGSLQADPELLRRAVSNLVSNALRYTPAGGKVSLRADADPHGAGVVTVEDTGPGVPEAEVGRLFERFFRGDPSRSASGAGSGLGLSIVQRIMGLHRGTVGYRPTEEGGARFELRFPGRPPTSDEPIPDAPSEESP